MDDEKICGINKKNLEDSVKILSALLNKKSMAILNLIHERGECSVTDVQEALGIEQPVVSTYLNKLKRLGVLESRKAGHFIIYKMCLKKVKSINNAISRLK